MTAYIDELWLQEQHLRLIDGDPLASSDIASAIYPTFIGIFSKKYAGIEQELIANAVVDAVIAYLKCPQDYPADKGIKLFSYLYTRIKSLTLNYYQKEKARKSRELLQNDIFSEPQEDLSEEMVPQPEEANVELFDSNIEYSDEKALLPPAHRLSEIFNDSTDQQMAHLVIVGVRATSQFSSILGIEARSLSEQKVIVKRHKDRIKKRLERVGIQYGDN
jgi:RNA polymerase sigma-70 factor (ECF subfamily)